MALKVYEKEKERQGVDMGHQVEGWELGKPEYLTKAGIKLQGDGKGGGGWRVRLVIILNEDFIDKL
jgi:hypothetical protein